MNAAKGDRNAAGLRGGVGAEAVAKSEVKLLHTPHQGQIAFADEILKEQLRRHKLLRDRHHQSQVGRDNQRVDRVGFFEELFYPLHLFASRPLAVEFATNLRSAILQPVHPPEVKLLLLLRQQPSVVEASDVGGDRPIGHALITHLFQRHNGVGGESAGEFLGVFLGKLLARDEIDRPCKKCLTNPLQFRLPRGLCGLHWLCGPRRLCRPRCRLLFSPLHLYRSGTPLPGCRAKSVDRDFGRRGVLQRRCNGDHGEVLSGLPEQQVSIGETAAVPAS